MRQQEIEETPGLGFSVGLSAPQRPKELPSLLTTNQEFEYSMQSSLRKPRDRKITLRRKPNGSRFAATASGKVELERHSRKGESHRRREKSRSLAKSWYLPEVRRAGRLSPSQFCLFAFPVVCFNRRRITSLSYDL